MDAIVKRYFALRKQGFTPVAAWECSLIDNNQWDWIKTFY